MRWVSVASTFLLEREFDSRTPMFPKLALALFLTLSFTLAISAADNKQESIDGTWLPETAELAGKPFPEEIRKSIKLVVKDNKYTVNIGKAVDEGTLELNGATKPKQMDITGSQGPNKGKKIPAIYEIDGDTLKVCYNLGGEEYPKEFKSPEGMALYLVTYKRAKE